MADVVGISQVVGALTGFVDKDIPVAYFATARTLTEFAPVVADAPDGGTVVVDLRTGAGGAGGGLSATVPDGLNAPASPATGSVSIPAGGTLYLRVTADGGGGGYLGGTFTVDSAVGVTTMLTNLSRVKGHAGITGVTEDDLLNTLIQGVSAKMQSHMRRGIAQKLIAGEKHDGQGWDSLLLREWPVEASSTVTVTQGSTVLTSSDWELHEDRRHLVRLSGGSPTGWPSGRRNISIDYTAGYAAVPEDLALAATLQVRHEFAQSEPSGQNRVGLTGRSPELGGSESFESGEFLPSVLETMRPYQRVL